MQIANSLIKESSPYLRQHAYNPVEWMPWGKEALDRAVKENKVMLVSIGYSACHWCHVMEHECFEDQEVAELQNKYYINIKVDREERPDVDQLYMDAVQAMGMRGGWPLNVFLLPDGRPFYGGTYFPKSQWMQVLHGVQQALEQEPDKVQESAAQLSESIKRSELEKYRVGAVNEQIAGVDMMKNSIQLLYDQFDAREGGMGSAPKFPMPCIYDYLLLAAFHTQDPRAEEMLKLTLEKMALGGLYDQAGGGFARYSVDELWHVPHFEKMLYDNAQLISLYSKAYRKYKDPLYEKIVRQTVAFLQRELSSPKGLFFSALDADSEGEEGKFYVFKMEELHALWGSHSELLANYFRCTQAGNWEHGQNILFPVSRAEEFEQVHNLNDFEAILQQGLQAVMKAREQRIRPGLDDKVLLSWNAMTISALCEASKAFGEPTFEAMALQAFQHLKSNFKSNEGSLYRTLRPSSVPVRAFLEDYATWILACLDLYELSGAEELLQEAKATIDFAHRHFYDAEDGFYHYSERTTELIHNKKELFDNVIPSANGLMASGLLKYSALSGQTIYREMAQHMISSVAHLIKAEPRYMAHWAYLHAQASLPAYELVFAGLGTEERRLLYSLYLPGVYLLPAHEGSSGIAAYKGPIQGKATFYLCTSGTCLRPVHTLEELLAIWKDK